MNSETQRAAVEMTRLRMELGQTWKEPLEDTAEAVVEPFLQMLDEAKAELDRLRLEPTWPTWGNVRV